AFTHAGPVGFGLRARRGRASASAGSDVPVSDPDDPWAHPSGTTRAATASRWISTTRAIPAPAWLSSAARLPPAGLCSPASRATGVDGPRDGHALWHLDRVGCG